MMYSNSVYKIDFIPFVEKPLSIAYEKPFLIIFIGCA